MKLIKQMTASLAAVSLAAGLALAPAPALASDGDRAAKVIFGAVALGLVAKSLSDKDNRRHVQRKKHYSGHNGYGHHNKRYYKKNKHHHRHHGYGHRNHRGKHYGHR